MLNAVIFPERRAKLIFFRELAVDGGSGLSRSAIQGDIEYLRI